MLKPVPHYGGKIATDESKPSFAHRKPMVSEAQDFRGFATTLGKIFSNELDVLRGRKLRILDVGYGHYPELVSIRAFAEKCGLEVDRIVGIERSEDVHELALKEATHSQNDTIALVHGNAKNATWIFGEEKFDLIIFRHPNALIDDGCHMEDLLEGVKEVAAHGAIFALTFYSEGEWTAGGEAAKECGLEIKKENWGPHELLHDTSDEHVLVAAMPRKV